MILCSTITTSSCLLRSDVSLDPSVAAKMNADLLSEVLSEEPGDDEVFLATDGDAYEWANAERSPRWHRSIIELEKSRLAVQNDLPRTGIFQHSSVV